MNKVKDFLSSHGYLVKVRAANDFVCTVTFPILEPISQQEEIVYEIKDTPTPGISICEEIWVAPSYALRLLINFDILHRMKKISLHESLISYYNKDGKPVEDIRGVLKSSLVDEVHEGFLYSVFVHAAADHFAEMYEDVAISHQVHTGYRILKGFYT